jgi:hypothetical protein
VWTVKVWCGVAIYVNDDGGFAFLLLVNPLDEG